MFDEFDNSLETNLYNKVSAKNKHKIISDGFKKNKVVNDVLDKKTIMNLYDLIRTNTLSYVNGVVKSGKESVIFWAVDRQENDVALKIYLVTTSNFKKRISYIQGDPRFTRVKKGTRNLIELWAKKEFRNLTQCYDIGIPCVKPLYVTKNILAMDFVGQNGVPEKTLVESEVNIGDYESVILLVKRLYKEAKLIHGDLSEYNIFKTKRGLMLFDFGSAVDLMHPNSTAFLKRDIKNISNFFLRRGLTISNPSDIFLEVTK